MIDVITGAYHAVHCEQPQNCPADCSGRMTTKAAVAVHRAIMERINEALDAMSDAALLDRDDLQESLAQMRRGEGVRLHDT